jgi:hypothetical protein
MLNVHLNGDIVRCPDIREILLRKAEENFKHSICKYGTKETDCPAWITYCNNRNEIKPISQFGRCFLCGSEICPKHIDRHYLGSMAKTYKIDSSKYRKISSSAHYLVKVSDYKTLFITLTFPPFKRYVNDKEINRYFSRFVENLRKRYNCSGYIAVREHGSKNNRVHFHLLISIPFISFNRLNHIWCNTISDICHYSQNALQSDKKTLFITNPQRAMRYVCKYFAKCKGQTSESRIIFISDNVNIKHKFYGPGDIVPFTIAELFEKYNSITVCNASDYTTCFRFNASEEFESFCNNYLYPIFKLSPENPEFFTFHDKKKVLKN